MMTLNEYKSRIDALAIVKPGTWVQFIGSGFFHGATARVEKVDIFHTHGGTRENPWWNRHEESCFTRDNLYYALVMNARPDGTADWRWNAHDHELRVVPQP